MGCGKNGMCSATIDAERSSLLRFQFLFFLPSIYSDVFFVFYSNFLHSIVSSVVCARTQLATYRRLPGHGAVGPWPFGGLQLSNLTSSKNQYKTWHSLTHSLLIMRQGKSLASCLLDSTNGDHCLGVIYQPREARANLQTLCSSMGQWVFLCQDDIETSVQAPVCLTHRFLICAVLCVPVSSLSPRYNGWVFAR